MIKILIICALLFIGCSPDEEPMKLDMSLDQIDLASEHKDVDNSWIFNHQENNDEGEEIPHLPPSVATQPTTGYRGK